MPPPQKKKNGRLEAKAHLFGCPRVPKEGGGSIRAASGSKLGVPGSQADRDKQKRAKKNQMFLSHGFWEIDLLREVAPTSLSTLDTSITGLQSIFDGPALARRVAPLRPHGMSKMSNLEAVKSVQRNAKSKK